MLKLTPKKHVPHSWGAKEAVLRYDIPLFSCGCFSSTKSRPINPSGQLTPALAKLKQPPPPHYIASVTKKEQFNKTERQKNRCFNSYFGACATKWRVPCLRFEVIEAYSCSNLRIQLKLWSYYVKTFRQIPLKTHKLPMVDPVTQQVDQAIIFRH